MYGPIIWLAKVSLLVQLIHIFASTHQGFLYWTLHTLIWTNLVMNLSMTISIILQCRPREKIWDPLVQGTCINVETFFIASGIINMISDIAILLLPLWAISNLQLSWKKKVVVSGVFATGGLCVA